MNRVAAILVLMVGAGACAVGPEGAAQHVDVTVDAAPLGAHSSAAPDENSVAVSSHVVRDNRLVHVARELDGQANAPVAVVEITIVGPTPAELRSGLWSAVPIATTLASLDLRDEVATIDLSPEFASIGGVDELLAIGQLVLSLTALPNVDAVTFKISGTQVSVPLPDGALVARPVTADDYSSLLDQ